MHKEIIKSNIRYKYCDHFCSVLFCNSPLDSNCCNHYLCIYVYVNALIWLLSICVSEIVFRIVTISSNILYVSHRYVPINPHIKTVLHCNVLSSLHRCYVSCIQILGVFPFTVPIISDMAHASLHCSDVPYNQKI